MVVDIDIGIPVFNEEKNIANLILSIKDKKKTALFIISSSI
jgi:glycosyltransferase involved in cell wall biosynthesis